MTPHLLNQSLDPSLTGSLHYYLPQGSSVSIGGDPSCTIPIRGIGIKAFMAVLMNEGDKTVKIFSVNDAGVPLKDLENLMDEGRSTVVRALVMGERR